MPVSKTIIPLDDEETIRRFAQEIRRRSTPSLPSLPVQVENFAIRITQRDGNTPNSPNSQGEDRATQTEPVTITTANGVVEARNGDVANPKSALDSVLLQSPPGSGVVAPPSTPENHPVFSEMDISQLIIDNIESLPPSSTFTLAESRHAVPDRRYQNNTRGSSVTDHVSWSMPRRQLSQADEILRNQSFPRLSFQAADSPPLTARETSPASASFPTAESSPIMVITNATADSQGNPATVPTTPRPAAVTTWNSFASGVKAPEPPSDSAIGPVSQGTAALAVSDNKQAISPLKDTAKPPKPDNWLPPHLRTPDYAFKDPNIIKPNRSYLSRVTSGGESAKDQHAGSVPNPVAEATTAPAKAATSDDPGSSEPILTPSSVIFRAVSPPMPTESNKEDRESQLYFSAWVKPEQRYKAAAKIRKAVLTITNPTASIVASLVWGGVIEEIYVRSNSADVLFAYAEDCQNYCDATARGIKYNKDGRDVVVYVEKGKDVDVTSGQLSTYLERGFTRCVRAVDVLERFTLAELWMKAGLKNRKVEGIEMGKNEAGFRYVVFRFCSISHAVAFKQAIVRDEEWEHCNIHHVADPCAQATKVHFGNEHAS